MLSTAGESKKISKNSIDYKMTVITFTGDTKNGIDCVVELVSFQHDKIFSEINSIALLNIAKD